jgi:peptide methionine sulfoxide reductase MsrB
MDRWSLCRVLDFLSDCCRGLELPKRALFEGATDPPQRKLTNNSHDLKGSTSHSDVERGVFCCAIGGLPLFDSLDLMPTTVSSAWLFLSRPVANDHIVLVEPNSKSVDQRIEVLCAKITCHLGHYFGKGEGYCTNASAVDFVAVAALDDSNVNANVAAPISWRTMEAYKTKSLSVQLVQKVCLLSVSTETLVFDAGCFWIIEAAFRRLPRVVFTETGYAGGITTSPTNEDVCERETQHAEVIKIEFDPAVLKPRILIDCFLAFATQQRFVPWANTLQVLDNIEALHLCCQQRNGNCSPRSTRRLSTTAPKRLEYRYSENGY